ncbi:MAG: helix-turn-helix domain-containing protein [Desulfomonile tiedjei]|nr:helix-turn-helix domain-containing protein [Desulfomonile tiedjei]
MNKEPEVLTTEEAADFLRLSPYGVRDLARRKVLPGRKVGRDWRFYRADLVAWLRGKEGGEHQREE